MYSIFLQQKKCIQVLQYSLIVFYITNLDYMKLKINFYIINSKKFTRSFFLKRYIIFPCHETKPKVAALGGHSVLYPHLQFTTYLLLLIFPTFFFLCIFCPYLFLYIKFTFISHGRRQVPNLLSFNST